MSDEEKTTPSKSAIIRRKLEDILENKSQRYYTDDLYMGDDYPSPMRDESPNYDVHE